MTDRSPPAPAASSHPGGASLGLDGGHTLSTHPHRVVGGKRRRGERWVHEGEWVRGPRCGINPARGTHVKARDAGGLCEPGSPVESRGQSHRSRWHARSRDDSPTRRRPADSLARRVSTPRRSVGRQTPAGTGPAPHRGRA